MKERNHTISPVVITNVHKKKHIVSVHECSTQALGNPIQTKSGKEGKKEHKRSICDYHRQDVDLSNHISSVHNFSYKVIHVCTKNAKI